MEYILGEVVSIFGRICEYTIKAVGHQLGYQVYYNTNVEELITRIGGLQQERERIEMLIGQATRNGREIHSNINVLLSEAKHICEEVEELLTKEGRKNTKCSTRSFPPNLVSRHRLSRKAKKMEIRVSEMMKDLDKIVKLDDISYIPKLESDFGNEDYMTFHSRDLILDEIVKALGDEKINMIGVWGMAGVGKTTLVREVARRAKEDKLVHNAVEIVVSLPTDTAKVQQELAQKLELKFENHETSQSVRKDRLRKRLEKETKLLIILDDVWEKLDLNEVGICSAERDRKKYKIIVTSRSQHVLCNNMGITNIFQVGLISPDEAWKWFSHIVADSDQNYSNLKSPMATQIVKECDCLPLAIDTVARALKNKSLSFWEDALTRLQRPLTSQQSDIGKVYSKISLSYDFLQDDDAKSLFLLCSLFEEDAQINMEYLMRYGTGWGLKLENVYTCEEARKRVHALLEKLKGCRLLLGGEDDSCVRMHDVVRDVGILIASKSHMYNVRNNDELQDRLKRKTLQQPEAISLLHKDIDHLPERLECSQLKLIWKWGKNTSLQIPDHFFEETKELSVLDLSNSPFSLPSSFCLLQNLRTLCLRNNEGLKDIALIGELRNLEILDLSNSGITLLPEQIGNLSFLRLLDLNNCSFLTVIETNVISSLKGLEELYTRGVPCSAHVKELMDLTRLTALHLSVMEAGILPRDLPSEKLQRYDISIGHVSEYEGSRFKTAVKLNLEESRHLIQHGSLQRLVEKAEELQLEILEGSSNVIYELNSDGFPELKLLKLRNNATIEYIVDAMEQEILCSCSIFPKLESLYLDFMMKLEKICHGKLPPESFGKLSVIEVSDCAELKNLFSFSVAKALSQLKQVEVFNCMKMEEIVTCAREDPDDAFNINLEAMHQIEFSQLCVLRLQNLPSLKQLINSEFKKDDKIPIANSSSPLFNNEVISFPKLQDLQLFYLPSVDLERSYNHLLGNSTSFKNLRILMVYHCPFLKNLFSSSVAVSLVELIRLEICYCDMIEEIISITDEMILMDKFSIFPKLRSLRLEFLPKLAGFSTDGIKLIEFGSLTYFWIEYCPRLENLFDEKVSMPNLETLHIGGTDRLKMIWKSQLSTEDSFCKLQRVSVSSCKNLVKIFPCTMLMTRLNHLEDLYIHGCDMLEEVFQVETQTASNINDHGIAFPQLQMVAVEYCSILRSLFPLSVARGGLLKLEKLRIKNCGIETIVSKDKEIEGYPTKFVLPRLTKLHLFSLPHLVTFYPGLHTCNLLSLNSLKLIDCPKVNPKLVFSTFSSSFKDTTAPHQTIFSIDKVTSLKTLRLKRCTSLNEIVWQHESGGEKEENATLLSYVKKLKLSFLPELMHLWDDIFHTCSATATATAFQNLEYLKVKSCDMLKNLVPSSVCFRNLRILEVSNCHGMMNLLTSSTAKSLVQLEEMEIGECRTITEIIANTEGDLKGETIVFQRLRSLKLYDLPSLTTMYKGTGMLSFPNLEKLVTGRCPQMQSFSDNISIPRQCYAGVNDLTCPEAYFVEQGSTSDTSY